MVGFLLNTQFLAASVLLLWVVCWRADVDGPAVGVEYVLAAVALVEGFA
jgi:hypothetical protein